MACDRGNLDSVKHIVEKWQVDVNATGAYYIFNRPEFDLQALDASPLFVAAYQCHYEVVRYLVEKGANIFAETSEDGCLRLSGLTPFYASIVASLYSTISTRQQGAIVRFLLESAGSTSSALARLTACEKPLQTPFWNMCRSRYIGPEATVTLVKYGMSLNERSIFGTILTHWASESLCFNDGSHEGSLLELVQLLVEKGADLSLDDNGYTPLFLAAMPGYYIRSLNFSVFDFLLERQEIGRLDKIDALEFAGAVILSFSSDATQVPRAFAYLRRAHHLRYLVGYDPTPKTPIIFKKTLKYVEWTTLQQLEEIENDPSQHKIASLLVHLRILFAPDYWHVHSYFNRGPTVLAAFDGLHSTATVDSFNIALEFILRYDRKQRRLWSDTVKIVEKLVALLKEKPHLCTSELLQTCAELITTADQSHLPEDKSNRTYISWHDYAKILSHVYTLLRFVSVLADHPDKMNDGIVNSLTQLVKQDGRTKDGLNLLLVACSMALDANADLSPTIRLLLRAQANPNAVDLRFRSPLHILADFNYANQERIDHLGNLLVENGAHPYMVDEGGRTVADIWLLLRNQGPKRQEDHRVWDRSDLPDWCREDVQELKCYSATIVNRFRIPYVDEIPASLYPFMEKH